MKKGRKSFRNDKASIRPEEGPGITNWKLIFGIYYDHPLFRDILWSSRPGYSAVLWRDFFAQIKEALLRKDAAFFDDIADILRSISTNNIYSPANPRLEALANAHFNLSFGKKPLPTLNQILKRATAVSGITFNESDPQIYKDMKMLGLKYAHSKKCRGPGRHGAKFAPVN
jgi:hypothetical protein